MDNTYDRLELGLKGEEDKLQWKYVVTRLCEYMEGGFSGRLVINIQRGRIDTLHNQEVISGITQTLHYLHKLDN